MGFVRTNNEHADCASARTQIQPESISFKLDTEEHERYGGEEFDETEDAG